jgi:hypothetical protein|tara:strand:- start:292 stop:849 length:558 start_codon:yes stop_codon:yes gene_type:complete
MKSFEQYLTESKKTYEFNIGVAGELPDGFEDMLETSLKKFNIVNMSAGKRTPIQERPLDFPRLQNCEVTFFEVEVDYPTTPQVLQEYVGTCCGIDQAYVIVRNINDPREEYQKPKDKTPYESVLNTEDMGGESAQDDVAGPRIMNLLKELEVARQERDMDMTGGVTAGKTKDIQNVENSTSVVGG